MMAENLFKSFKQDWRSVVLQNLKDKVGICTAVNPSEFNICKREITHLTISSQVGQYTIVKIKKNKNNLAKNPLKHRHNGCEFYIYKFKADMPSLSKSK